MLVLRRSKQIKTCALAACRNYMATQTNNAEVATQRPHSESEYADEAQYPKILDPSFKAQKEREAAKWHDQIRDLSTVEEKLIKINMPRYYGYKVVELSADKLPYNCLPAIQHYTRTIYEEGTLQRTVMDRSEELDIFVRAIKSDVQDAIELTYDYIKQKYPDFENEEPMKRERLLTQVMVEQVNRALINALSADFPHLQEVEVDYNPRHEAFWFVGGINPPKNMVRIRESIDWQKEMAKDPIDRLMQYSSSPMLAVRHSLQLSPWKSEEEVAHPELAKQVPRFEYDPRTLGFVTGYKHGTNIPGYWPGSGAGFGCISYQSRANLLIRPKSCGAEDSVEALHAHAIQSSFAWLLAQANYNGFNTFSELTYPMNTQTIITNGREWSFYEYQLNTLLMHNYQLDKNPRVNFCRGTEPLLLYQEIDANGRLIGLDEQVLRYLVQFYINAPRVKRSIAELQPYLGSSIKRIADYADEEKRTFLERTFKHLMSNRPRHLELPEIYLWEKIYKIDNKTRPLDARRRFFELFVNPWKRTLDQRDKEYIPRAVRPGGPKSRKRFKATYYP